jgi:hypothetical protein
MLVIRASLALLLLPLATATAMAAGDAATRPYPLWAVTPPSGPTVPGLPPVTAHIAVDQFGYFEHETKVAVIGDPQAGYNVRRPYIPASELQLCRVADQRVVHRGAARPFAHGQVDRASGDRGWWFDFTAVTTPGDYYVFDPKHGARSHVFHIGAGVFRPVLRAAMRVFFYQREAFAHEPPFAEAPWTDRATYLQDRAARSITAPHDASSERDLSGGWMDAGDTNKYPTFLPEVIHPLLYAWHANPAVFGDDFAVPESGNGLPDLLDEIKWELDWLVKMQEPDGGVYLKMGHNTYSGSQWPLSADQRPRFYGPKSSASTIATAGVLAHAARVYRDFPAWQEFARSLEARAECAWRWYRAHPRTYNDDHGEIKSGDADRDAEEQDRLEAIAAFHLWRLTGQSGYHEAFLQHFASLRQMNDHTWSPYEAGQGEVLLEYAIRPDADPQAAARILRRLRDATHQRLFMPQDDETDLYRSWIVPTAFHWGSNQIRCSYGVAALNALTYVPDGIDRLRLGQRARDVLHGMHGVNPLGLVYLTNLRRAGAELDIVRLYHEWFSAGSPLATNPPPGYVVGGPNHSYTGNVAWLKHQPDSKCYADFNLAQTEHSWEMSEPGIYYQAMYLRLLAGCLATAPTATPDVAP